MRQGGGARPRVEMAGDAREGCLLSLSVIGQFVFIVTDFMGQVGGYLRQYSPQFIADNNLSRGTSIASHFLSFYSFYQTPITTEDLDSSRVFKHFFLLTLK